MCRTRNLTQQTHNLLLNLYNVGIFHFRTSLLPIHKKFSVSPFVIPRLITWPLFIFRFANCKAFKRFSHEIGENIYFKRICQAKEHISMYHWFCLTVPNTQVTNNYRFVKIYVFCDIRPYLRGVPLKSPPPPSLQSPEHRCMDCSITIWTFTDVIGNFKWRSSRRS
jgi:hypothetical protein